MLLRRVGEPAGIAISEEKVLRLAQSYEPEPDITLRPADLRVSQVDGGNVVLVIEIAVSTLSVDLDVKAPRYAAHGVREYWVVDAKRLVTHVHRAPGPDGYAERRKVGADETLTSLLVPALSLRLADIGLEPLTDEEASAAEAEEAFDRT